MLSQRLTHPKSADSGSWQAGQPSRAEVAATWQVDWKNSSTFKDLYLWFSETSKDQEQPIQKSADWGRKGKFYLYTDNPTSHTSASAGSQQMVHASIRPGPSLLPPPPQDSWGLWNRSAGVLLLWMSTIQSGIGDSVKKSNSAACFLTGTCLLCGTARGIWRLERLLNS